MAVNKEIDTVAIGRRIREERKKLNLSREELAEIVGLSDYYVGQLERGERQMSLPVLVKIVNCLHVSLDYLIFGKTLKAYPAVNENHDDYMNVNMEELSDLLKKCSPPELTLIKRLIKAVLPYIDTE
ncbi:MAG: helix-turn-helix transcriptional regulator [Clostridiales bacterium]|jgi:transcriptional regulator with XRE-family HTH domain|nr:helix-turn-helix transcriptional regulator [Clostridiales bacterium]